VLGDDLVAALDHEGIAVSTGSACLSGSREPSEALQACGLSTSAAQGGLRLIFSRTSTSREPVVAAAALARVSERIRVIGAAQ
jgi:cysteine desulfurase